MESFGSSVRGMRGCVKVACRFLQKKDSIGPKIFRNRHPQIMRVLESEQGGDSNDQQGRF